MQVRKFSAPDMREALAAVKESLGPEAIIVATRQIEGGLFKRPMLEVTAALEEAAPPAPAPAAAPLPQNLGLQGQLDPLRREVRALRSALRQDEGDGLTAMLKHEMQALRQLLGERGAQSPAAHPCVDGLVACDVDPHVAQALAEQVPEGPWDDALAALHGVVADALRVDRDFFAAGAARKVALVGPTGVGKTTTLAKIAAHAALVQGRRVALVSLDTYRVGAVDQLRHFAALMGVPLAVAHDAETFAAAVEKHGDVDFLLVDTAGRSPADDTHRTQLTRLFATHGIETFLTVAAATRQRELAAIVRAFAPLDPVAVVLTKLDEAQLLGALLNAGKRTGLPLAFVTAGQRVPEDLALPDARALAHSLLAPLRPRQRRGPRPQGLGVEGVS